MSAKLIVKALLERVNLRTNLRTNGFYPKCVIPQTIGITRMAGVAQLVERWIVIPVVEGSNPFARPSHDNHKIFIKSLIY